MRKISAQVAFAVMSFAVLALVAGVSTAADHAKPKVTARPASDAHATPSAVKVKAAEQHNDDAHDEKPAAPPAKTRAPAVRGAAVSERAPTKSSEHAAERTAEPATEAPAAAAKAKAPAAAHDEESDSFSVNELWADLAAGNQRFVAGKPQAKEVINRRTELAGGQHPQVIIVGCADSRCIPEVIFDKNLGELFVVRTAGNVADPVALGSIEYAAEHLHAKLIVVLGHTKCGAVAAAAAGGKLPSPNLEAIVAKISPALEELRGTASGDELAKLGVPANVHQSADDIVKNSRLIRSEVMSGKLRIIKAVYNIETGEVERLQ